MGKREDYAKRLKDTVGERVERSKRSIRDLITKEPLAFAAVIGYLSMVFLILYYIYAFIYAFLWLDSRVFPTNPVFMFLVIALNAVLFPLSTVYEEFNFNNIKRVLITINYTVVCLMLLSMLFHYSGIFIFLEIFSLKITPFVSEQLLISLARNSELFICGITAYGMLMLWIQFLRNKPLIRELNFFRLSHYVDMRENKSYQYDLHLGRNIENKKNVVVFEKDRFLHQTDNGVSGAGKTSLVGINGIVEDMDTRLRNERQQKKLLKEMLRDGKVYRCTESDSYSICDFKPYPLYQDEFEQLKNTYRVCGQTIMAPNDVLLDKVCRLAKARGIKTHLIDPTILKNGTYKEGFTGFNPLYISPKLAEKQDIFYAIAVYDRAANYRDAMQQLYLLKGDAGDAYFQLINEAANYNITMLCILTYPFLMKRQANPIDCLQELVNICPVEIEEKSSYVDKNGNMKERVIRRLVPSPRLKELLNCYYTNCSDTIKEQFNDPINAYFEANFVENLHLGMEIYKQSSGLRNLITSFVTSPYVKPILTAPDDNTLSIPEVIERGEIILYNFYLEQGMDYARVSGLFFLFNFNKAVINRPGTEDTRIPHFLRIDELPVLLHPIVSTQISLYRQYRTSCEYMFQSLSQMDENTSTRFLANIMMSCGTQLIFGRANLEEMERYSKLGGIRKVADDQVTYSEGSIWSETDITTSVRTTIKDEMALSQDDIRYRNFGECTVFHTRDGVAMPPVITRFRFLPSWAYLNKLRPGDWFDLSLYTVFEDEEPADETTIYAEQGYIVTHESVYTGSAVHATDLTQEPAAERETVTAPAELPEHPTTEPLAAESAEESKTNDMGGFGVFAGAAGKSSVFGAYRDSDGGELM